MIAPSPHLQSAAPARRGGAHRARASLVALVLALGAAWPAAGHGRDMTGKAGIGLQATTVGLPMLSFRYWRTRLSTEILLAWATHDTDPLEDPDAAGNLWTVATATSRVRLGLGILYRIGDQPRASLSLGVRPWLQVLLQSTERRLCPEGRCDSASTSTQAPQVESRSTLLWGLELPLQAEAFLSDHFSLHGAVSLQLGFDGAPIVRDRLQSGAGPDSVLASVGGGFAGGLGFSYYF